MEGIGTEVLYVFTAFVAILLPLGFYMFLNRRRYVEQIIHPAQRNIVDEVRRRLGGLHIFNAAGGADEDEQPATSARQRPVPSAPYSTAQDACPICWNNPQQHSVLTNCGHTFCGSCLLSVWDYSNNLLNSVSCPVCRASITILLNNFAEADSADREYGNLLERIGVYNRRFSGAPRSMMDHLRDIPVLVPHLLRSLFQTNNFSLLLRLRVVFCVIVALCYLLSPFDVLPEIIFGIVGLIDDFFVVFLMLAYLASMYRTFIGGE